MKMPTFASLVFCVVFLSSGCSAGARGDEIDIAPPRLGSVINSIPSSATKMGDCYVEAQFIDCEYKTAEGLFITVYGNQVTRKEIRRGQYTGKLYPLGLSTNFSIGDLRSKLQARQISFKEKVNGVEKVIAASRNEGTSSSYQFYVVFDQNEKWTVVGVTTGE